MGMRGLLLRLPCGAVGGSEYGMELGLVGSLFACASCGFCSSEPVRGAIVMVEKPQR